MTEPLTAASQALLDGLNAAFGLDSDRLITGDASEHGLQFRERVIEAIERALPQIEAQAAERVAAPTSITLDAGHDFHDYGPLLCSICGQRGQVVVHIEPQREMPS